MELHHMIITKTTLEKKTIGRFTPLAFKIYDKATDISTMHIIQYNIDIRIYKQVHRTEQSSEINSYTYFQLIFDKGAKAVK